MNNRQIKYRVWSKDTMLSYNEICHHPLWWFNDGDKVTQQFTGLVDKNGKDIYEGDIIETFTSQVSMFKGRQLFKIVWLKETANFIIWQSNSVWWTITEEYMNNHCKIIGNIFENKDLLT